MVRGGRRRKVMVVPANNQKVGGVAVGGGAKAERPAAVNILASARNARQAGRRVQFRHAGQCAWGVVRPPGKAMEGE